jgi:DeoR/GlpR family transcriptional regulator of sugar metabolism
MDVKTRRELLLKLLEERGAVGVSEASSSVRVSQMTIRRDLQLLAKAGLAVRVHGGAVAAASTSYEQPFVGRAERNVEAKQRIGAVAAGMIGDGETVILDVGTTALQVAAAFAGRRNLTILTPSLRALSLLQEQEGIQLMTTGGVLRRGELSLTGELAEKAFSDFRFDTFIMGVGGVHPVHGLTEFNPGDARVKKCALAAASRCVVVADHTKLGRIAFSRIGPLSAATFLVTDREADAGALEAIRSEGVEVILA